jgi:hypothetical protein
MGRAAQRKWTRAAAMRYVLIGTPPEPGLPRDHLSSPKVVETAPSRTSSFAFSSLFEGYTPLCFAKGAQTIDYTNVT